MCKKFIQNIFNAHHVKTKKIQNKNKIAKSKHQFLAYFLRTTKGFLNATLRSVSIN